MKFFNRNLSISGNTKSKVTALLLLATAMFNLNSFAENKPKEVNIGVQTLITPELVTRAEKKYQEYLGVKVNLLQFNSGQDMNQAFAAGKLDFGFCGSTPIAVGLSNGIEYEVIWYNDVIGNAERLVVKEKANINSLADLAGKKIATPFSTTTHYSLLSALKKENIDASKIQIIDLTPQGIYAAWTRGDIDGAYVWDPVLSNISKDGGKSILSSAELSKDGVVTADLTIVSKKFAKNYPEFVEKYLTAQIYGLEKFQNNQEEAIKSIATVAGISTEDAKNQTQGFIYPDAKTQISAEYLGGKEKGKLAEVLYSTAKFLEEQKAIEKAPDLSVFQAGINGEYLERVVEKNK
ncbi:MAG: ABC transporter substrate-binding protein [Cardiobacteriaceae bacterium]|nr:ABC transporter substrate-binding protein [Cardiobacteriaceae bacterium]